MERTAAMIAAATGGTHRVGVALDEWGVWHPESRRNGWGDIPGRRPITYEQAGTMRDGLAAAIALEGFHRQCAVLSLANLAQIVNVLHAPAMTEPGGGRMWLTPTYHVFRLHAPHVGATALRVDTDAALALPAGSPSVSATASARDGQRAVTLVNRHRDRAEDVTLAGNGAGNATGEVLTADRPHAQNGPDTPDAVAPAPLALRHSADGWHLTLPPCSVATVQWA